MRCFDEGWRAELKSLIGDRAAKVESLTGVKIEVDISEGYPSVYNNPALTERARKMLRNIGKTVELDLRTSSEDFGFYTERYPSLFYRLGVGYEGDDFAKKRAGRLHTAAFCPDTKAIAYGVAAQQMLTLDFLK